MFINDASLKGNVSVVSLHSGSEVELLIFKESERKNVFTNETNFQAACCLEESKCSSKSLILANGDSKYFRHILTPKTEEIDNSLFEAELTKGEWTIILANCQEASVILNGSIAIEGPSVMIDQRVYDIAISSIINAIISSIFVCIWAVFLSRSKVQTVFYQNAVIYSCFLSIFADVLICIYIWILNKSQIPPSFLLVIASFLRVSSRVLIMYLTLTGISYPSDVKLATFLIIYFIYAIFYTNEVLSLRDITYRKSGQWTGGFSQPSIFNVISCVTVVFLIICCRSKSNQSNDIDKQNHFFNLIFLGFAFYFIAVIIFIFARKNMTLSQARPYEAICYSLEGIEYAVYVFANAWFWFGFNPIGYQTIDDTQQPDLGIMEDEDVEPINLVGNGITKAASSNEKLVFVMDDDAEIHESKLTAIDVN